MAICYKKAKLDLNNILSKDLPEDFMRCFKLFYIFLILITDLNFAAIKIDANGGPDQSFAVPVGPSASFDSNSQRKYRLYVGATEEKEDNIFSVAYAQSDNKKFIPLFGEEVLFQNSKTLVLEGSVKNQKAVNNLEKIKNPLVGKAIAYLDLIGLDPAIVTLKNNIPENFMYLFLNDANSPKLKVSPILNDSNGQESSTIKQMLSLSGSIVAAVSPNGSFEYGQSGSGLALVKQMVETVERQLATCNNNKCKKSCDFCKKSCELKVFELFEASDANIDNKLEKNIKLNNLNKAAPLDISSTAVKINENLFSLTPVSTLFYDVLSTGYMGFNATSGSNSNDGLKSLVKIKLAKDDKLSILPIAPDAVFFDNLTCVGGSGANLNINVKFVNHFVTSTKLTYLVVLSVVNNQSFFYALPILAVGLEKGSLASLNALPVQSYKNDLFSGKVFAVPAKTAADFNLVDHPELVVGSLSPLPVSLQEVSSVLASGDAVLITVNTGENKGVFSTQALFDDNGLIAGWTAWARATGGDAGVDFIKIDEENGEVWSIEKNGLDVFRTTWGYGQEDNILGGTDKTNGFIQTTNNFFKESGVQGINEFIGGTISDMALTVTTGLNKIALAKTGTGSGDFLKPVLGDYLSWASFSEDGAWPSTATENSLFVGISGGKLNDLGPIVTSAIYTNLIESWLVVSGYNGLAIMANNNGHGWLKLESLVFDGEFKKIKSPEKIIKIMADQDWLYILTNKLFQRVKLDSDSILNQEFKELEVLADVKDFKDMTDFIVFNNKIYLGTTQGLFYYDSGWQKAVVPGVELPIVSLNVLFGSYIDQLYVLSGYQGYNESYLNRFFIKKEEIKPIALSDKFFKNSLAPFLNFGSFVDYFYTDGFRWLRMQAENERINAVLAQLKNKGSLFSGIKGLTLPFEPKSSLVVGATSLKSVGSLIINGSFGLWVNE